MLCLLPSLAGAATSYIDPSCANNGDGAAETCAASVGGVGAFKVAPNPVSGAGNQFLFRRGTSYLTKVVVGSGAAGDVVTLGAYGSGPRPIIRSEEGATQGSIQINTNAHDIVFDGLEVHGQINTAAGVQINAIRSNATDANVVVNITVRNCKIGPVFTAGGIAQDDGVDLRGRGLVILNNEFDLIANDGLWLQSDGASNDIVIRGNSCTRVSQVGANGDCYQVFGTSTGALIEHNTCDHSDVDAKQCVVVNGTATIRYNDFIGPIGGTVHSPILCDTGTCHIYGNKVRYGKVGIVNYGVGGATFGNLVQDTTTFGIEVAAPNSVVDNNTVINPGLGVGISGIRLTAAATNTKARNNIIHRANEGIRLTAGSGQSELNNLFHGSVTTPVYDTTVAGAIPATNSITASGQFVDESAGDYRLIGESVGKRAGLPTASCRDVRGRPCWLIPDIGAYQSSSGDPAKARTPRTINQG